MNKFFATFAFISLFSNISFASQISFEDLSKLQSLDSKPYAAQSGKTLKLVYFWATWCPDCKQKMKSELPEVATNPDFDFLFVNTEKDLELIKNFVAKEEVKFSVFTDFDKSVRKSLKVFSVPQWALLKRTTSGYEVLNTEAGFDYGKVKSLVANNKGN